MRSRRRRLAVALSRTRATAGLVALVSLTYAGQVLAAGHAGTAFGVAAAWLGPNPALALALSPLVHASHSHVAWNAAQFLVVGAAVERRVGHRSLLAAAYLGGAVSNALPAYLGYGAFGLGLSAAVYGLWTHLALDVPATWAGSNGGRRSVVAVLWVLGVLSAGTAVAQAAGVVPAAPGTAVAAHLTGVAFGALWWTYRALGR